MVRIEKWTVIKIRSLERKFSEKRNVGLLLKRGSEHSQLCWEKKTHKKKREAFSWKVYSA